MLPFIFLLYFCIFFPKIKHMQIDIMIKCSSLSYFKNPDTQSVINFSYFCCSHRILLFTANTSCGLPLKTLLRTPIFCDGTTVVLLAAVPGGSTSGVARSLFGGGTGLASLRCKLSILFLSKFNLSSLLLDNLCVTSLCYISGADTGF